MVITEPWQDRHRSVQNSHTLRMGRDWPLKPTIRQARNGPGQAVMGFLAKPSSPRCTHEKGKELLNKSSRGHGNRWRLAE
jgi:hypothetical protein